MRGVWRLLNRSGQIGLLLAAMTTVVAAADCSDRKVVWQIAYVSSQSDWQEFDASGRRLVHEFGILRGPEFVAGWRCGDWRFEARVSQFDGTRAYDGQTGGGVPAMSQSALRQQKGYLQASWRVTETWQLGGRLSGQTLWRDIASTAGASGYPERYDWAILSWGTQWETTLGPGQLTLAAWRGSQSSSSMQVNLPGFDPAALPLGALHQTELALGWRTQLSPAWHFHVHVRSLRTDMGAGADKIITRGGLPAGVAHQPRTSMVDRPLMIGLGYEF